MAPNELKTWLYSQLGLFAIYLAKELWKLMKDQSHKNTEDIGKLKIKDAKHDKDLTAAWERIRMIERELRDRRGD